MEVTFAPRGVVQIDDATIIYRNFRGEGGKYNREGDRNFALFIDSDEVANALIEAGYNVKIKPPREEGDLPFMFLPIKVKFNERGPVVYLESGKNLRKLTEESIDCLDDIDIVNVCLDIRPYHWNVSGKEGCTAYLQSIKVTQEFDRFSRELAESEYPEE